MICWYVISVLFLFLELKYMTKLLSSKEKDTFTRVQILDEIVFQFVLMFSLVLILPSQFDQLPLATAATYSSNQKI